MAVTELTLLATMALAVLLSLGLLVNMDAQTRVIMGFLASIVWGLTALSAFDVIVPATGETPEQVTITPLVYLGFGMGIIVGVFSLFALLRVVGRETGATEADGLID